MTVLLPYFEFSTDEDLAFELEFRDASGAVIDLAARGSTLRATVRDVPSSTSRVVLSPSAGTMSVAGGLVSVFYDRTNMASWPTNVDYTADIVEVLATRETCLCPVRFWWGDPAIRFGSLPRRAGVTWAGTRYTIMLAPNS